MSSRKYLPLVFICLLISQYQVSSLPLLGKIKNEPKSLKLYDHMTDLDLEISRPKRHFQDHQLEKLFDVQDLYQSNTANDILAELRSAYANNIHEKRDETSDTTTTTDKPNQKKVLDDTTRNIISDILSSIFEITGGLTGGFTNYLAGGFAGILGALSDTLKNAMPTSSLITPIINLISVAWSSLINLSGISNSLLYGIIGETIATGGSLGSELITKGTTKGTKLIEEIMDLQKSE